MLKKEKIMKNRKLFLAGIAFPLMLGLAGCSSNKVDVGLLYCSAEANSKYQVNQIKEKLEAKNLTVKEIKFSDSNDIQSVLNGSIKTVKSLYVPTDNTCASNSEIINNIVRANKVPVYAGEEGICEGCGAITLSISYYNIGVETGKMAIDVLLNKKDIKTLPIAYDKNPVKKYNKSFCEEVGVNVPSGYIEVGKEGSSGVNPLDDVTFQNSDNLKFKVGISQLVTHDALDSATKGFQDAVKKGLGEANVEFDLQNAAAQIDTCTAIAQSFVAHNYDLIMANATPALQAAANATNTIPVLGTSVTDYGVALAIPDFNGVVGTNVSGTSDLAPLDQQADMLAEVFADFLK